MQALFTNRFFPFALLILLVTLSGACQWPQKSVAPEAGAITSVNHLDWMAGHWVQEGRGSQAGRPRHQINEELWLAPAGGLMLGVNRTIEDGRAISFEYVMIREVNGRIAYLAMPGGQSPPTVFPLVESSAGLTAIFENPDHDFPKRIVYQREADQLTATLTGEAGEDGALRIERWSWHAAPR